MMDISEKETLRFKSAFQMIPFGFHSLLDVGCGEGVFLNNFVNNDIKKFALDQDFLALKGAQSPKSLASIDALPFAERAVDVVTCMEVIEHLPYDLYELALKELSRVAKRYILITVPYKQNLQLMLVQCPFCFSRFNPYLHVRSFDYDKVSQLFSIFGWVCKKIELISKKYEYYFPLQKYYKLISVRDMPANVKCPVCRHKKTSVMNTNGISSAEKKSTLAFIKTTVLNIFPKKESYSWIAGLYERECG